MGVLMAVPVTVTGGVWGSVDGCACLSQGVYRGVLMAVPVTVTGGVHGSVDGCACHCHRRCMGEC